MIARIRRVLVSLQGKLTVSYVIVTVLVTLVLEALLLAGLMLFISRSNFIPGMLVAFAGEIARDMHGDLLGSDAVLPGRIYRHRSSGDGPSFVVESDREGDSGGEFLAVVIGAQGQIITSSHPLSYTQNLRFDQQALPPEQHVVAQALQGITATNQLGAWLRPPGIPIAAYPVFTTAGTVGGAVYLRGLGAVKLPQISEFATLIGISALALTCVAAFTGTLFGFFTARPFTRRLARLSAASNALAGGDLGQRVIDSSGDEIGQLGRQFNQMSEQLERTVRSLRLMAERNAQLAEQARQLAVVEERNRLARDLHDSVSQQLFSITMLVAATRSLLASDPQQADEYLVNMQATAQQALHETRTLIHELRPATLNSKGLGQALREHVQSFRHREHLDVDLQIHDERRLPLAHDLALFRIAQEALSNVARHAMATAVQIVLHYEPHAVSLEIADNGVGFASEHSPRPESVGLSSMAERASELGGTLTISSHPGSGTQVVVQLPVVSEPVTGSAML